MAHLPARPRIGFAIQVQFQFRQRERRQPVGLAVPPDVAQQIRHGRGTQHFRATQWQPADRANLLLKLTGNAGVDGQMTGVVRAWRQFVHQ